MFVSCYVVQYLVPFLVSWGGERESLALYILTVLLVLCGCYCSLALPHGAVCLS